MKLTVILVVIGALGTVSKGFIEGREELGIGKRTETIRTTEVLRLARILKRIMESLKDLLSLGLLLKPLC